MKSANYISELLYVFLCHSTVSSFSVAVFLCVFCEELKINKQTNV